MPLIYVEIEELVVLKCPYTISFLMPFPPRVELLGSYSLYQQLAVVPPEISVDLSGYRALLQTK